MCTSLVVHSQTTLCISVRFRRGVFNDYVRFRFCRSNLHPFRSCTVDVVPHFDLSGYASTGSWNGDSTVRPSCVAFLWGLFVWFPVMSVGMRSFCSSQFSPFPTFAEVYFPLILPCDPVRPRGPINSLSPGPTPRHTVAIERVENDTMRVYQLSLCLYCVRFS